MNMYKNLSISFSNKRWVKSYFGAFLGNHILTYPTPRNSSYAWSFGFLAGICLITQILSGLFLAMHYTPDTSMAFNSVEYIMRNVKNGWLIRYTHSNGASMFFLVVYCYIFRGFYYGSYMRLRRLLWNSGVILYILMVATAFTGYALPMIGQPIVHWLWGGYTVNNATLKRFYSIHFFLPFIITGLTLIYLILLHKDGSNNPLGSDSVGDEVPLYPYFVLYSPNVLSHSAVNMDAPEVGQKMLQDPATQIMEGLLHFNGHLLILIVSIVSLIGWLLASTVYSFKEDFIKITKPPFVHAKTIEIIWTSVPALILLTLASPSFSLIYSMDELTSPELTLKIIGHQWFWDYEISDYVTCLDNNARPLKFAAYLLAEEDLKASESKGYFRLLETNKRVVLPVNTNIRLAISSVDVLHSWTIPSCGIKVDACPGRLNLANLFLKRIGLVYGQCSEICGVDHGFMPINAISVSSHAYAKFITECTKIPENPNLLESALWPSIRVPSSTFRCRKGEDLEVHCAYIRFFPEHLKRDLILNIHMSPWYQKDLNVKQQNIILKYERAVLSHKWAYRNNPNMINKIVHRETWDFYKHSHNGTDHALEFLAKRSEELYESNLALNVGSTQNFWIFVTSAIMGHALGFGIVYGIVVGVLGY